MGALAALPRITRCDQSLGLGAAGVSGWTGAIAATGTVAGIPTARRAAIGATRFGTTALRTATGGAAIIAARRGARKTTSILGTAFAIRRGAIVPRLGRTDHRIAGAFATALTGTLRALEVTTVVVGTFGAALGRASATVGAGCVAT